MNRTAARQRTINDSRSVAQIALDEHCPGLYGLGYRFGSKQAELSFPSPDMVDNPEENLFLSGASDGYHGRPFRFGFFASAAQSLAHEYFRPLDIHTVYVVGMNTGTWYIEQEWNSE